MSKLDIVLALDVNNSIFISDHISQLCRERYSKRERDINSLFLFRITQRSKQQHARNAGEN